MQFSIITCGLLGGLGGPQLILIILIAVLIFGGTSQIPKIMRNLGKGVHSFRQGLEDAKEEMRREVKKADSPAPSDESHSNTESDTQSKPTEN